MKSIVLKPHFTTISHPLFTEQFNQVNILPFVKTTNIVTYRGLLPHENQINRNRDLLQKPITSVFAVSIDW
jgi:hypothetical protein